MIYSIVAYGDPVLRKETDEVENSSDIKQLIKDMYETMYNANGVGLAAPQIGRALRIFIVDSTNMREDEPGLKKTFINPTILEEEGEEWSFEEGCLSIPGIHADVFRPEKLKIHYFDENGKEFEEEYQGIDARVIQHEYDHIEGVLFTDHISNLKKRLLKKKLENISRGKISVGYKMKFPKK